MNEVIIFLMKNKEEIIVGIIATAICSFFAFLFKKIINIKKRLLPQSLSNPKEEAIYLNFPKESLDDSCVGRNKLLKKVLKKITDGKKSLFIKKCLVITGKEGIGKTLFCYTLFQYYLRKYPVYIGWIKCKGKQSIFDIISNTFDDFKFYNKSKDNILNTFNSMSNPCILFVDQINQYTPLDELEELSHCSNVILILSGLLRKIDFADYTYTLSPLSDKIIYEIFEKQAKEKIENMSLEDRKYVTKLLEYYIKGNPFLAIAFANAKCHYRDNWENVLKSMQTCEYEDENYLRNILRRLYKLNELSDDQKFALLKLSSIKYASFTESVFELLDISYSCVKSLCDLYWLEQKDNVLYSMDDIHRNVVSKLYTVEINLKVAINSINKHISGGKVKQNNMFRWISLYIEDILEKVQGFVMYIMEEAFFFEFAYNVADNYQYIKDYKKSLEWLKLCKSENKDLAYNKSCTEFQAKYNLVNTLYSPSEVDKAYIDALEKAKATDDFENRKRFLLQEYCSFLIFNNQYNKVVLLCKEYFEINSMDLSNEHNCEMFYRYLCAARYLDNKELLNQLVNETTISILYQNERVSITVAWSFGVIGEIYKIRGDKEASDKYIRHMVVLVNDQRRFFDKSIGDYLNLSEEEFAEYMHSCNELLVSLNSALYREDAEAFYIEGRYQEKHGNYADAIMLYKKAATKDSLRGMSSLALLYYRGQGEERNYDKAREYWNYCCKRGHRGAYYWLGILLLDNDYKGYDRGLALHYLSKAAELGSERAKQKLLEINNFKD